MHSKRIAAGSGKKPKWMATATPGPHRKENSMTMLRVIRDVLKYADNAREGRTILRKGLVSVNKKIIRETGRAVGLMDVLEIPKLNKNYRVLPAGGSIRLKEIPSSETSILPCKINDKQTSKKGGVQLNLHDGTNILLNKNTFKTRDTLVLELPSRKIKDVLEYKKGNTALICRGRHSGHVGLINEIREGKKSDRPKTKVGDIETLTEYVFVIGKDKPLISI
jgi:small subunit ribosomal protein S4e